MFSKIKLLKNKLTNKISNLPVMVLMPHSSCNCRCVMCDIWKANANKQELSPDLFDELIADIIRFKVKEIAFSGGEALLSNNLWTLSERLKANKIKLTLLSTGLLFEKHAEMICTYFDELIVSLDGDAEIHNKIRRIPNAFEKLATGVSIIKTIRPNMRITGRSVIQSQNYKYISNTVNAAINIQLDSISFLTADVSSQAFNHNTDSSPEAEQFALSLEETKDFEVIIDMFIHKNITLFDNRFIVESPQKMKQFVNYYYALNGEKSFPKVICNAPWVSSVIEADGSVKPCFFHDTYANLNEDSFSDIINSKQAITFRKNLDVSSNVTCQKCVCSLNL